MKEIGGYFELEFKNGNHYHSDAIALNTGRNCFEYILVARNIKKIFMPIYTCDVMFEPIKRQNVEVELYSLNEDLEPILPNRVLENEPVLYTNYFGLKQKYISNIQACRKNIIIDNAHGFFHPRHFDLDTFYSARKFFGVPDGAFLFTDKVLTDLEMPQDFSYERSRHLIKRIEMGSDAAYSDFLWNEEMIGNQPIKKMSTFTENILRETDYQSIKAVREKNFMYLHERLFAKNELKIDLSLLSGPSYYPLLLAGKEIRSRLITKRIYVSTFWKNVIDTTIGDCYEHYISEYLYPLPIDQRYDKVEMDFILEVLKPYL
jgi:hypothetical protein